MRSPLLSFVLMNALVPACSAAGSGVDTAGAVSQGIVHGSPSLPSQDAVVLLYDQIAGFECTGTLVSPNLVLTARHCVSNVISDTLQCDRSGNAVAGGVLGADYPPSDLAVVVGTTRATAFPTASARGVKIFHDSSTNLCNHDLALLQLDQSLDAPIARLRLDADPSAKETVTVVGWGVTSTAPVDTRRQQRTNIAVLAVGPTTYLGFPVPPGELLLAEGICDGDSGAPAIASSGAVVGVAGSGSNGTAPSANDPAAACVDATQPVINVFAKVASFKGVIEDAFAVAGGAPLVDDSVPAQNAGGGCGLAARHEDPSSGAVWLPLAAMALARRERSRTRRSA